MKHSGIMLPDAILASDVIGHWEWDIPNDRLYADATLAQLFSVDPALAEAGAPLSLFLAGIHRDDREKTAEIIARSAEAGRSYVQEYRVHAADGATRWVLARGLIELDADGRPRRGTGFLIDITESRLDEDACRARIPRPADHPLEQAAELCLAARHAIQGFPDPLLQQMTDMLLLEIGRRLATLESDRRRARMH